MKIPLRPSSSPTSAAGLLGTEQLKGRVWVADFVFTSCPPSAPSSPRGWPQIRHRSRHLGDAFHLVTFTVDPENDTPERLNAYAKPLPRPRRALVLPHRAAGDIDGHGRPGVQDRDGERAEEAGLRPVVDLPRREPRARRSGRQHPRLLRRRPRSAQGDLLRVVGILANMR